MPSEFITGFEVGVKVTAKLIANITNDPVVKATIDTISHDPLIITTAFTSPLGFVDLIGKIQATYDSNSLYNTLIEQQNNIIYSIGQIQANLGVLQATTAVIGVGTFAGVALSGANLWQTLKLREDVKQLRLEVKNGFIDLKQAFKDQGTEIIKRIDEVANDIKFQSHRLVLIEAYGLFLQATKLINLALQCDENGKNANLQTAQDMLAKALADYNNPQLYTETCAAGQLRRMECSWAIEQTRALIFLLQKQPNAATYCLSHLEEKIRHDTIIVASACGSEDELAFLFPEILRIHTQDLPALKIQMLPPEEQKALALSSEKTVSNDVSQPPPEQALYDIIQQKSHYQALRDVLQFIVKPELRRQHESYISKQAPIHNLNALAPSNWQEIPDLTVANLYHYFKTKEQTAA
jgi:hypothetical protein